MDQSAGEWSMITIDASSKEAVVLNYLLAKYPVTVEELQDMLSLSGRTLERVLKRLIRRGIIILEPLPGKTYIRMRRMDIRFVGINPSQQRALKHSGKTKNETRDAEDVDYAYL